MSTLYLVRHGQASFGAANYDVLSDIGSAQSRALGLYWAERGVHLDAVYTGPRQRHAGTTQHLFAGAREQGIEYPETAYLEELDEYPAFKLLAHWAPILTREDPAFRSLLAAVRGQRGVSNATSDADYEAARAAEHIVDRGNIPRFERAFGFIMDKWARGELDHDSLETFARFRERVSRGLRHIMETEGREKTVAVITSGGPVCIALQMALSLDDHIAIRQGWVIGNSSVSEFRYRDSHSLTLVRFNLCEHLRDESLITYR